MSDEAASVDHTSTRRRGVFSVRAVRLLSFGIISISLFATTFLCVLSVWNYADKDIAWRSLATLGIIVVTMVSFTVINEVFGERV